MDTNCVCLAYRIQWLDADPTGSSRSIAASQVPLAFPQYSDRDNKRTIYRENPLHHAHVLDGQLSLKQRYGILDIPSA